MPLVLGFKMKSSQIFSIQEIFSKLKKDLESKSFCSITEIVFNHLQKLGCCDFRFLNIELNTQL